jgi:uncharacterized phage-associated protein
MPTPVLVAASDDASTRTRRYVAPMTSSANSVITAIQQRRPDQDATRIPLLLFFCQGHHLADTGTPLFAEPLHATPDGVHVDLHQPEPAEPMNDRLLGTVGTVLHRYADMTTADLRSLVQHSSAWQLAQPPSNNPGHISWSWLSDWFRRPAEREGRPSREYLEGQAAAYVARRKATAAG